MKNNIKILNTSNKYTNFYVVFISYKNKKFKIEIKIENSRVNCHVVLFSNNMLINTMIATDADFNINTNNFKVPSDSNLSNEQLYNLIDNMYNASIEFIKNIF